MTAPTARDAISDEVFRPTCVFENAHLPVKTASGQHVRYCVGCGRTQLRSWIGAVFICIDCVKQGRRLPANGRVPRTANQFFRGPGQAIFASASISNSLLRGPRGHGFGNLSEQRPSIPIASAQGRYSVLDLSKPMMSRPGIAIPRPWGRAFAVFLV